MAEDIEQSQTPQSSGQKVSRRTIVIGLIGLAIVEAISGGLTWRAISQRLYKLYLAFFSQVPTATALSPGATLYTYRGHSSGVNTVKWSPNGKRIASGSDDQTVQLWDAMTGKHPFIYKNHHTAVNSATWSPNGGYIASGDGTHILPSVPTDTPVPVPPPTDTPVPVPPPTDTPVPPPTDTPVPPPTDTPVPPPTDTPAPSVLRISLTSLTFNATQGQKNPPAQTIILTNPSSTRMPWTLEGTPSWLTMNPSHGALVSLQSQEITITISSVNLAAGNYNSFILFNTTNPDGTSPFLAIDISLTVLPSPIPYVLVWKAVAGNTALIYTGHKDLVNALVWLLEGTRIVSASNDTTVQVWDATHGNHILTYKGHSGAVLDVAVSPDGKHIASASADKTVRVWELASGENTYIYRGHNNAVNSVIWSHNGKYIASASSDTTVQVWNATHGDLVRTYLGHSDIVNSVIWSPDDKYIASASSDATVQVWNASTGRPIVTYKGHVTSVNTVAWSPHGMYIASGGRDTTVQVWKAI